MPNRVDKIDITRGRTGDYEVVHEVFTVYVKDKTVAKKFKQISDSRVSNEEASNVAANFVSANKDSEAVIIKEEVLK